MQLKLFFIALIGLVPIARANFPPPTDVYVNKVTFVKPDIFHMLWNFTDTDITFEVHVKTSGWLIFGLSPREDLEGSDVVTAWVNPDGSYSFKDRFIKNNIASVDKVQNWFPISVRRSGSYLIAKFTRKLKICDANKQDIDITDGTPLVLIGWGQGSFTDNLAKASFNVFYKSANLINTVNNIIDFSDDAIETYELSVNVI